MDVVEHHELPPLSRGIQIGVDIGQRRDSTAIVVAERVEIGRTQDFAWGRALPAKAGQVQFEVRYMERLPLGTPYPDVARRLAEIVGRLPRTVAYPPPDPRLAALYQDLPRRRSVTVCVDATGVGQPVVDVIVEAGIDVTPVYITAGRQVTETHGELHLAKEQMVSYLQVLVQQRRILLPDTPEANAMVRELLDFEIRVTEHANAQFEARTGSHDDYVTALALATWDVDSRRTIVFQSMPDWFTNYRG